MFLVSAMLTVSLHGQQTQSGSAPTGESRPASGSTAGQISQDQLAGLPLNGRSYSQLATLQGGVSDPSAAAGSRGIGGGGLTVSGGRSTSNVFLQDNTNIMDIDNQVPRSAGGVQLGSDAVFQVQVFSTNYSAEYGRGSGGVLNSISRSGTPEFHGSLFEYFRNSNLDARNFYDPGKEPPPFKRNQFGFTLTGPIVQDRTFFMGSFEMMRDRLSETDISNFPDAQARLGIITDKEGRVLRTVPVHPQAKRYWPLYPMPNGARRGGGVSENAAPQFLPTNESYFTVRVDHKLTDKDSLFVRYTFDDATSHQSTPTYLFTTPNETRQQYATLVGSHIFNPSLLNAFRLAYTRPAQRATSLSYIDIPRDLFFVKTAPQFGQLSIAALSPIGPFQVAPEVNIMNTFQIADDVVMRRGNHGLKMGFEAHRYRWDIVSGWQQGGSWSFNSLESFLQGGPDSTSLDVALPGSNNRSAYRQTLAGFYVQDAYNVRPNLQFNMGLRYEFSTLISEDTGKTAFIENTFLDATATKGPFLKNNPSLKNISPRLGITWSPGGNRNTVISAGGGIYYDHMIEYIVDQRKSTVPFYKVAIKPNFDATTLFPDAVRAAQGTPLLAQILDYANFKSPTVLRYNFSIQHLVAGGWRMQAAYVGARGNHLYRGFETNQFPLPVQRADGTLFFAPYCVPGKLPSGGLPGCDQNPPPDDNRINKNFGSIRTIGTDAQSFYNSLQLAASKAVGQNFSVQVSYTFSKSIDDASSQFSEGGSSSQFGLLRTNDRSLSDFNIRHRMTTNYFYSLPFGPGQRWSNSGIAAGLLGGWRIGGILTMRSGVPYSPQIRVGRPGYLFAAGRPNLIPGGKNNATDGVSIGCKNIDGQTTFVEAGKELGGPELYYDPCMYSVPEAGTMGNAGRNTIIAASVFNTDISIQRDFLLDSKRRLQFRAEVFNFLNHTSFNSNQGGSTILFTGSTGRRNTQAGVLTQTATTARQIQFALRLSF